MTIHHINIYSDVDDEGLADKVDKYLDEQGSQIVKHLEQLGAKPTYAMHAGAAGTTTWVEVVEDVRDAQDGVTVE